MPKVENNSKESVANITTHSLMDCLLLVATLEGRPTSNVAVSAGMPLAGDDLTPELFNRAANRAGLASRCLKRAFSDIPAEVLPAILVLNTWSGTDALEPEELSSAPSPSPTEQSSALKPEVQEDQAQEDQAQENQAPGDQQKPASDIHIRVKPLAKPAMEAVVLSGIDRELGLAVLTYPDLSMVQIPISELEALYGGEVYYLRPLAQFDSRTSDIYQTDHGHWFWSALKSCWRLYRDVLLASFFINLFVLAQPLFVMNVYDRVVPNNAVETLWAMAIGVVIVYVFDQVLKILRTYLTESAAKRVDVVLSGKLFAKVLGIKMHAWPNSTGAFVTRLHDFDMLRNFVTSTTILTLVDLPFLLLFVVLIAFLGGWLAILPVLAFPLALAIGYIAHCRLRPVVEQAMAAGAKKNAILVESMVGVETIKAMGAEGKWQRTWESSVGQAAQWGLKSRILSNNAVQAVQFIQQFTAVAMVVWGVYMITELELTMGGLIACMMLNGRAVAALGQVTNLLVSYDHARNAMVSLDEIVALPCEREMDKRYLHRPVIKGDIHFNGVTFAYPEQQVPALKQLNLTLSAGEKVAIIGKVGSGKSTLAKMLVGLYQPTDGSVLLDGLDLQQLDPADVRNNVGYLGQDSQLFFGTVRDNIIFGRKGITDVQVIQAAARAGVLDLINGHPQGFEMLVGERGENLSGGQRAAIFLARIFLRQPQILLLDEPTAAMDQASEDQLQQQITHEFADKTVIVVTHKPSMLKLADRLVVLDKGAVVADGPKEVVLEELRQGHIRAKESS